MAKSIECSPMAKETRIQSLVKSYQRLKKVVLDATLLNTQYYQVQIKGKVEQSRKKNLHPPLDVIAISKGAFELPSTMITNYTYLYKNSWN